MKRAKDVALQTPKSSAQVAVFAGAGFSKLWGLPLACEIIDDRITLGNFPGKWQQALIRRVQTSWLAMAPLHGGSIDEFGRLLQRSTETQSFGLSFQDYTSFLALRLSSEHWSVGRAHETKWGTGDHVRKQRAIPAGYSHLLRALKTVSVLGFVTTNYDLVIEKLLGPRKSGRLGGFCYLQQGEELKGRHAVSSKWTYGPAVVNGSVPLLKLNGSLNWAVAKDGTFVKYIDARPSRGRRYRPLLVPPATGQINNYLEPVWARAGEVLTEANIWLVCGYSLPEYDHAVRKLLKAASAGRLATVIVLDKTPNLICSKLRRLVPGHVKLQTGCAIGSDLQSFDLRRLMQGN
jgi:hypothetical protein